MKKIRPWLAAMALIYLFLSPVQSSQSLKLTAVSTKELLSPSPHVDPIPLLPPEGVTDPGCIASEPC